MFLFRNLFFLRYVWLGVYVSNLMFCFTLTEISFYCHSISKHFNRTRGLILKYWFKIPIIFLLYVCHKNYIIELLQCKHLNEAMFHILNVTVCSIQPTVLLAWGFFYFLGLLNSNDIFDNSLFTTFKKMVFSELDWLAKSADLNVIIQHLWDELEPRLWARLCCSTSVLDLTNAFVPAWGQISAARFRNLVESLKPEEWRLL